MIELLPDREQVHAQIQDIYDTYRADGPDKAMANFMAHAGLGGPPARSPARRAGNPHPNSWPRCAPPPTCSSPTCSARPRTTAPTSTPFGTRQPRIVVAAGAKSKGQLAHRGAAALADRLGPPVVEFPGDHGGFVTLPDQCAQVLDQVLTEPT